MEDTADPRGGGTVIEVEVKVDTSRFERMMSDMPDALARARDLALRAIGQAVASRATMAFRTASLRPSPWSPRKPSKKDDGHPLLIRTGALRQSIRWRTNGTDTVVVGTDRKYAIYHQRGTKRMPARPFFPFDAQGRLVPDMERKIQRVVETAYASELEKMG